MSQLDEVGERDAWRCWICDEAVDPDASVNDARGPSVDSRSAKSSSGKSSAGDFAGTERLAHRACNTKKGAVTAVIPWPSTLMVLDPAPLVAVADRLHRKGGREIVARCPDKRDAKQTADWLEDRFSRLAPNLPITTGISPGGGQFLVTLAVDRKH
jgi:hypothetical protein